MSIEKMLCVSNAHLTPGTWDTLQQWFANQDTLDPNERPFDLPYWIEQLNIYSHGQEGFVLCIAGDVSVDEEFRQDCPPEMLELICHADDNGCEWLLIDTEAEVVEGLPTFE